MSSTSTTAPQTRVTTMGSAMTPSTPSPANVLPVSRAPAVKLIETIARTMFASEAAVSMASTGLPADAIRAMLDVSAIDGSKFARSTLANMTEYVRRPGMAMDTSATASLVPMETTVKSMSMSVQPIPVSTVVTASTRSTNTDASVSQATEEDCVKKMSTSAPATLASTMAGALTRLTTITVVASRAGMARDVKLMWTSAGTTPAPEVSVRTMSPDTSATARRVTQGRHVNRR